MSLHDKIMNLPKPTIGEAFYDSGEVAGYSAGFKSARHAAAELALEQDALVVDLVGALNMMYGSRNRPHSEAWLEGEKLACAVLAKYKGEQP